MEITKANLLFSNRFIHVKASANAPKYIIHTYSNGIYCHSKHLNLCRRCL